MMQAAAQLEDGQLPCLKTLLLQTGRPMDAQSMRPCLLRLFRAGCSVHLLPHVQGAGSSAAAYRELAATLPDADMLRVGMREEVHGKSVCA